MLVLQDHLCFMHYFIITQISYTSDSSNRKYCFMLYFVKKKIESLQNIA